MSERENSIAEVLDHVINKVLFLRKKRLFQFKGVKLYPSEVHLMLLVGEKGTTNATRVAERLGVTKGAVSQTLSRLDQKGVLSKTKDPYNKNELTLSFTPFGEKAFQHCAKAAGEIRARHARYLASFTKHEQAVIRRFLAGLADSLDTIK